MPTSPTPTGLSPGPRRPRARHIVVWLEQLDDGRLRVSTPQARGFAVVARGPAQLWHAVAGCFREATIAGYAAWRGERYDLDGLTDPTDPTEPRRRRVATAEDVADRTARRRAVSYSSRSIVRPDQADPADWTPLPDGSWESPNGRHWRHPKVIGPLIKKRALLGLSTCYEEHADPATLTAAGVPS